MVEQNMEQKQIERMRGKALLTDLYQLTMNAAYHDNNKDNDIATFDLFIRKLPQDWAYFVANGIEDAIDYITNVGFAKDDIDYLREQALFNEDFLTHLQDFRFNGEVYAVKEGTPVAPNAPIMRVTAKRNQAQFLETTLLNIINSQTLIATKANRVVNAAAPAAVIDFGLRRAQEEDMAMKGARAAYLAGAVGTSNVKAGKEYGIPIKGTHAHSFVMGFTNELDAFRAYVKTFPNNPTLLIDTYDTLQGARNAVTIAKELNALGKNLGAVRLDSGDLTELSKQVRKILDEADLNDVKIIASDDLNEFKIAEFKQNEARIDGYGVGTEMITAKPVAAISGVYKLVADNEGGKIKLAPGKKSFPGKKQIYRIEENGKYVYDVLALENENVVGTALLEKVILDGERVRSKPTLNETREYVAREVAKLPDELRGVKVDKQYAFRVAPGLEQLIDTLTQKYSHRVERGSQNSN